MPLESENTPNLPNIPPLNVSDEAFFLLRAMLAGGTIVFNKVWGVRISGQVYGIQTFNELNACGFVTDEGDLQDGIRERYGKLASSPMAKGRNRRGLFVAGVLARKAYVFLNAGAAPPDFAAMPMLVAAD